MDQGGHLLTQSNTSGRDLNDAQLKYASDVEGRIQRRIEAILSPIVGNGNIHAQVTAQLDFASKEQTEEQYRPNGDESHAALRSRQLNESEQSGSGYPGGVPGALSNQPAPANNAPISTPPANQNNRQQQASTTSNSGPRSTQRNETSNYEVDRPCRYRRIKAVYSTSVTSCFGCPATSGVESVVLISAIRFFLPSSVASTAAS